MPAGSELDRGDQLGSLRGAPLPGSDLARPCRIVHRVTRNQLLRTTRRRSRRPAQSTKPFTAAERRVKDPAETRPCQHRFEMRTTAHAGAQEPGVPHTSKPSERLPSKPPALPRSGRRAALRPGEGRFAVHGVHRRQRPDASRKRCPPRPVRGQEVTGNFAAARVRHPYSTLSLDTGIEPKILSDRVGNSNPVTFEIYAHRSTGQTVPPPNSSAS